MGVATTVQYYPNPLQESMAEVQKVACQVYCLPALFTLQMPFSHLWVAVGHTQLLEHGVPGAHCACNGKWLTVSGTTAGLLVARQLPGPVLTQPGRAGRHFCSLLPLCSSSLPPMCTLTLHLSHATYPALAPVADGRGRGALAVASAGSANRAHQLQAHKASRECTSRLWGIAGRAIC